METFESNMAIGKTKISLSSVQSKRRIAKLLKHGSAVILFGLIQPCPHLPPASRPRGPNHLISSRTSLKTLTVRYSCTDIYTSTEKAGNGSTSMPLKMWVLLMIHLSVTHSFFRVNWQLKASPTSFATQASSSGGWMKENGVPPATLPDWLHRQSHHRPPACPPGWHWLC